MIDVWLCPNRPKEPAALIYDTSIRSYTNQGTPSIAGRPFSLSKKGSAAAGDDDSAPGPKLHFCAPAFLRQAEAPIAEICADRFPELLLDRIGVLCYNTITAGNPAGCEIIERTQ